MAIAAFDFYDFTEPIQRLFKIAPTEPLAINFGVIGFESIYVLVNLGSISIFYLVYIGLLLLVLPLLSISKKCKRPRQVLSNKLKWNSMLSLLIESYQVLVVCTLINIQKFSLESSGLATMSIVCVLLLSLAVVLPFSFITKLAIYGDSLRKS